MEKESNNLIDTIGYRKKNRLKQSQLALYLDASASYVSLIETGNSKLSTRCLKYFWDYNGIDHSGLVPSYDRLLQLALALGKLHLYSTAFILEDKFAGADDNYFEPFEDYFSRKAILSIKYGQAGITDEMAEELRSTFTRKINKDWLINGSGDMFIDDTPERILISIGTISELLEKSKSDCHDQLNRIEKKIDKILNSLKKS